MGNMFMTVNKYEWLDEGETAVKASWVVFRKDGDLDDGDLAALVGRWLETRQGKRQMGSRELCSQRKRPMTRTVVVQYDAVDRHVSGEVFCEVTVAIDTRSMELLECTLVVKHY